MSVSPDSRNGKQSGRRHAPALSRPQSVYEWAALALAGLPAVAGTWLFGSVRTWSVSPLVVCTSLAALLTLLRPAFFPAAPARRFVPGWMFFLLFLAYAAGRAPFAAVPYDGWLEIFRLASYASAFWVWTELAGHHRRWRVLLGLFLLSATFMAWYALIQQAHGTRMVLMVERPAVYGMRASGAYICPNHFANLLEIVMACGFGLAACPPAGALLRMIGGYAMLVALPPLYLTQSRSGWIGAFVGLGVAWCVLSWRKSARRLLLAVAFLPLIAAAAGWTAWTCSSMVRERITDALHGNVRLALWKDAVSMIRDRPWIGHGPGSFRWVYPLFQRHMTSYLDPQFAHNDALHALAEYGGIGFGLIVLALAVLAVHLLARVRKAERDTDACLIAACLGALAASLAHCMFDYNLQIFANVHALVLLAGLAAASLPVEAADGPRPVARVARMAASLALLAVAAFSAMAVTSYLCTRVGNSLRDQLDYEAARARYTYAITADARNWAPYLGMGHLLRLQGSWNKDLERKQEQMDEARRNYEACLSRNPWQTEAMYGLGKLYEMAGDQERALRAYRDLVGRTPYHQFYLTELGLYLRRTGRYAEALERFKQAQGVENSDMIEQNIALLQEKLGESGAATAGPPPAP